MYVARALIQYSFASKVNQSGRIVLLLLGKMLRLYSYLYHLALALFLLGISSIAMMSSSTLRIPILPWTGGMLNFWLFWGSIAALVSIVLAVTGIFRYLFPLWALAVLVLMVRGYILQPAPFSGREDFQQAMLLTFGALLAFIASLTLFAIRPRRA
jgi:hypothetical protein